MNSNLHFDRKHSLRFDPDADDAVELEEEETIVGSPEKRNRIDEKKMERRPFGEIQQLTDKNRNWSSSEDTMSPMKSYDNENSQDSGVFSPPQPSIGHRVVKKISRWPSRKFDSGVSGCSSISNSNINKQRLFSNAEYDNFDEDDEMIIDEGSSSSMSPVKGLSSLLFSPILCKDISSIDKENIFGNTGKSAITILANENQKGTPISSKTETFKRPSPSNNFPFAQSKRAKSAFSNGLDGLNWKKIMDSDSEMDAEDAEDDDDSENNTTLVLPKTLIRPQSESSISIKNALERIHSDPMLIGDASKRHLLPLVNEKKNEDLMEITGETLTKLMRGEFNGNGLREYEIIDCRYPFEYEHGHIAGSTNIYTQKMVYERFLMDKVQNCSATTDESAERKILIFHCEFSSKRAPDLCRYLRSADRICNMDTYPALHFPEIYLLKGGYKDFFASHQEFCNPPCYMKMDHEEFSSEYRFFKQKSKSELYPKDKFSRQLSHHHHHQQQQQQKPFKHLNYQKGLSQLKLHQSPPSTSSLLSGKSFKKLDL